MTFLSLTSSDGEKLHPCSPTALSQKRHDCELRYDRNIPSVQLERGYVGSSGQNGPGVPPIGILLRNGAMIESTMLNAANLRPAVSGFPLRVDHEYLTPTTTIESFPQTEAVHTEPAPTCAPAGSTRPPTSRRPGPPSSRSTSRRCAQWWTPPRASAADRPARRGPTGPGRNSRERSRRAPSRRLPRVSRPPSIRSERIPPSTTCRSVTFLTPLHIVEVAHGSPARAMPGREPRGNPVPEAARATSSRRPDRFPVRNCPAAVNGNDRRHEHWPAGREATASRRLTGRARQSEDLPCAAPRRGAGLRSRGKCRRSRDPGAPGPLIRDGSPGTAGHRPRRGRSRYERRTHHHPRPQARRIPGTL